MRSEVKVGMIATDNCLFRFDAFRGDVHLEGINLAILRIAEIQDLYK
jgi:hypothetical protein